MQQYSEKNQERLIAQCQDRGMAPPTDVKSFKAWAADGRRIKKGEKALQVWCPIASRRRKGKDAGTDQTPSLESLSDDERRIFFRDGNVFDIQQTETQEEWKARLVAEEMEVAS